MRIADSGWTGVVLAGGRSSRMGQDKALLPWQGQPLLQHMQTLLQQAGATRVVVSGDYPGFDAIPDRIGELGPLGGIASVAEALPDGVLLLVPVDMPLLTPALLAALAAADGRCVCYPDHVLPMRLHLDEVTRQWLQHAPQLPHRQRSVRAMHAALGSAHAPLATDGERQLINCNTPDEWAAIHG
ncbi:MAG: molybdenum cofactor guanylyltransferase [Lysobacteraceae bacterium]